MWRSWAQLGLKIPCEVCLSVTSSPENYSLHFWIFIFFPVVNRVICVCRWLANSRPTREQNWKYQVIKELTYFPQDSPDWEVFDLPATMQIFLLIKKKKTEIGPRSAFGRSQLKKRAQATADVTIFSLFPQGVPWACSFWDSFLIVLETFLGPSDSTLAVKFPALGATVTSTDRNPAKRQKCPQHRKKSSVQN